jgi:hypothetical protein
MQLPAMLRTCGLAVLLVSLSTPWSATVLSAQGPWFQVYREGLDALAANDLPRAESKLKEALSKRSQQGRNVPVPGRPGIIYLPQYYLGLVYVKAERFQEA